MANALSKQTFFTDLVSRIRDHQEKTRTRIQPLSDAQLGWSPKPGEWSILQCFDHLNQTHDYYNIKIRARLADNPPAAPRQDDLYEGSFWGRFYMFFAFNPRFSFPAPAATVPGTTPTRAVLDTYLGNLQALLQRLEELEGIDLRATRIPIEKGMHFNLGDCLKILVYHDALHIRQAEGVRRLLPDIAPAA